LFAGILKQVAVLILTFGSQTDFLYQLSKTGLSVIVNDATRIVTVSCFSSMKNMSIGIKILDMSLLRPYSQPKIEAQTA
jgi:hypothetical protein